MTGQEIGKAKLWGWKAEGGSEGEGDKRSAGRLMHIDEDGM